MEYLIQAQKYQLQIRGLYEEPKDKLIDEFKKKDLILTQDKIDLMKKNRNG